MHNAKTLGFAAAAMIVAAGLAFAQQHGAGHGAHGTADATTASTAKEAFEAANARMHQDMTITYSGDTDVDFPVCIRI